MTARLSIYRIANHTKALHFAFKDRPSIRSINKYFRTGRL